VKRLKTGFVPLLLVLLLAPFTGSFAQQSEPKFEMGTFYLVMLIRNPNAKDDSSPETAKVFQAHVKHIISLLESGKALLAGPFMDNDRIAGLVITASASEEEARALEEADPIVQSGRFHVEVLKWWAAKGVMKSPRAPVDTSSMTKYYFGMIRRGPKWTAERNAEIEKLQAGHMANINAMAKAGKLVIAGPFENGGEYAGVFVFKVDTLEEARALADGDPAVKAGRLVVDIHPWMIAKGSLP
jgi:uncharacterized protein YciI